MKNLSLEEWEILRKEKEINEAIIKKAGFCLLNLYSIIPDIDHAIK
jgi:hypothetical protein